MAHIVIVLTSKLVYFFFGCHKGPSAAAIRHCASTLNTDAVINQRVSTVVTVASAEYGFGSTLLTDHAYSCYIEEELTHAHKAICGTAYRYGVV